MQQSQQRQQTRHSPRTRGSPTAATDNQDSVPSWTELDARVARLAELHTRHGSLAYDILTMLSVWILTSIGLPMLGLSVTTHVGTWLYFTGILLSGPTLTGLLRGVRGFPKLYLCMMATVPSSIFVATVEMLRVLSYLFGLSGDLTLVHGVLAGVSTGLGLIVAILLGAIGFVPVAYLGMTLGARVRAALLS